MPSVLGMRQWIRHSLPSGGALSSDLVVAAFLVSVVAMVVVPLPTVLLDVLIALNIAVSLGLLLVAMYVAEPSHLAALPSLLLLATLFRLGLNVSTTRLVLLQGDAGRIVEAFGRVIVGGNVVVGAVVFLVMVIVQFIVIAKGSERVAEVAARFTLDALPGKQMSIDADLRSGSLSLEQAQARRRSLERESQLYGALDGAMKFVKGDAIAGLIIVAINIIGGLAIGIIQRGMTFGEAAAHYTVLTVGDGLAAQLPSLFVSATAGLVVTRVPGDGASENLGGDITAQISAQPRALALTAGLLAVVACVPGLPMAPFLALGGVTGLAAAVRLRRGGSRPKRQSSERDRQSDPDLTLRNCAPVIVSLGADAHDAVTGDASEPLVRRLPALRREVFGNLGVRLPEILIERDESRGSLHYAIAMDRVMLARGELGVGTHWAMCQPNELKPLGIVARSSPSPIGSTALSWMDADGVGRASSAGYKTGERSELVALHIERTLESVAYDFVGVQESRDLVDALEVSHPALVAEVVPRLVPLGRLADVLRRLVAERVSIRDLRAIFEAIASTSTPDADAPLLTEIVRRHLRRQITYAATGGRGAVVAYMLSRDHELHLLECSRFGSASPVPIDPGVARSLIDGLAALEAAPRERDAARPVLVVQTDIRRVVRSLVEAELPDLPVIAVQELMPEIVIQPIGTV